MKQEKILILKSQQQGFIDLLGQQGIDKFSVEKHDEQQVYVVFRCHRVQLFEVAFWLGRQAAQENGN